MKRKRKCSKKKQHQNNFWNRNKLKVPKNKLQMKKRMVVLHSRIINQLKVINASINFLIIVKKTGNSSVKGGVGKLGGSKK